MDMSILAGKNFDLLEAYDRIDKPTIHVFSNVR